MTEVNKGLSYSSVIPNNKIISELPEDDNSIEELLRDMGEESSSKTLFRDEVIREICSILISDKKPNAMQIGPAGSGKTEIVEELATRMKKKDRSIPKKLYEYAVYSLNLSDLVLDCALRGELERRVKDLVTYLESDEHKAILFLDEIHILFESEAYLHFF